MAQFFIKRDATRRVALLVAVLLLAACDGISIPIPPTPTPGAMEMVDSNSHTHGSGGSNTPLFTRYGGDVAVAITAAPAQPRPNAPATITYDLTTKEGAPVTADRLMVTHERLMHLIVVSRDLSYFAHLHPHSLDAGRYAVTETLPAPGPYLLFNEFYMSDGKHQVERDVLSTEDHSIPDANPPLVPSLGVPQESGGLRAVLTSNARKMRRRASTSFKLRVTDRGGKAVTELEPFLGAPAHVVMVSADTKQFAHSHADLPGGAMAGDMGGMNMGSMVMPTPPARFGPDLQFAHTFMQPGLYRIWVQFGYKGEVVTFGFNVEVYR